jgi:Mg2+ and Co2+ transporter CorA
MSSLKQSHSNRNEKDARKIFVDANEIKDISITRYFGLHPLTVEAVLHQNQPSKIEEYTRYNFCYN